MPVSKFFKVEEQKRIYARLAELGQFLKTEDSKARREFLKFMSEIAHRSLKFEEELRKTEQVLRDTKGSLYRAQEQRKEAFFAGYEAKREKATTGKENAYKQYAQDWIEDYLEDESDE